MSPTPSQRKHSATDAMLPLSLLKTAQGHQMLIELKSGETYNGTLVACDSWMNILLEKVVCTSKDGQRFWQISEIYIRGSRIKYICLPDDVIDLVPRDSDVKKFRPQTSKRGGTVALSGAGRGGAASRGRGGAGGERGGARGGGAERGARGGAGATRGARGAARGAGAAGARGASSVGGATRGAGARGRGDGRGRGRGRGGGGARKDDDD